MGAIFFLCLYALLYDVKRIHKMQNEKELKKKIYSNTSTHGIGTFVHGSTMLSVNVLAISICIRFFFYLFSNQYHFDSYAWDVR